MELEVPVSGTIKYGGKDVFVAYDYSSADSERYLGGYKQAKMGYLYVADMKDLREGKNIFTQIDLSYR
jgi:hypothetical protein